MTRLHVAGFLLGSLAAFVAMPAAAQVSAANRNAAQALFDDAKDLMAAGKYAEACPKLEESQRLDPSGGTMINLALCHEREGRIATAWSDFKEALSNARRDGRADREQACLEHIASLGPRLPRVTLAASAPVEGLDLVLDGAPLDAGYVGRATALDPGSHQLKVSAPGKKPWQTRFDLAEAEQKTVTIPALEDDPAAAAARKTSTRASSDASTRDEPAASDTGGRKQRMISYIVGGAGVVSLGFGTFFGVQALSKKGDSDAECPSDDTCSAKGVALNDDANTAAWVANIGVGLGLVGVGVAAYLFFTADGAKESVPARAAGRRIWLDANPLPNGGRVTVGGAW